MKLLANNKSKSIELIVLLKSFKYFFLFFYKLQFQIKNLLSVNTYENLIKLHK